ncbi:hypothetical protein A2926_04600 [Candidatus Giovannonibacteria bacterium RIFCSPLOWO2_01_FULL_44_40]|uniref:Uncharacterized protein n=1 Tax=Candidatus Giovannonibacteria bacterium RIFCSPHIGHO2_01_FULL_45_23 TaxID=1798325 RepID=A0A1F5VHV4_9BACT|nr:MAG: hypothetical protein A2834_03045 [Candidatus Giovannonibacteria bacterium RIFCSPHIGHO2_01_FULL_45_23]OGF75609.1 MAG: hypothetical protein A3C77_00905 [Candidatus Giovannonibacteria bacterium RIFCSPHIGHO2_02_FULL_45_13]OGF80116.1 MAG: hypothetical protein A2926_04600 [Candidatus Giovannonibacteria bacterium RIFCSPLOWO2_01_FULL_44_40]
MTTATIQKELERASRLMGVGKKKLVDRALLLYLDSIRQQLGLFREFEAWDRLSDEALLKFESNLQHEKR